jgi:hypothetical protein
MKPRHGALISFPRKRIQQPTELLLENLPNGKYRVGVLVDEQVQWVNGHLKVAENNVTILR